MRRISVLDDPPEPPEPKSASTITDLDKIQITDYLYQIYPTGTPLNDLDADLLPEGYSTDNYSAKLVRAAVVDWAQGQSVAAVVARGLNPSVVGGVYILENLQNICRA